MGYERQGYAVWTAAGCRVMSSLRLAPPEHAPTARATGAADAAAGTSGRRGVCAVRWGPSGLRLLIAERSDPCTMAEASFLRPAAACSHLPPPAAVTTAGSGEAEEVHVLHGHDRLLFVTEAVAHRNAVADGLYAPVTACKCTSACAQSICCAAPSLTSHACLRSLVLLLPVQPVHFTLAVTTHLAHQLLL